MRKILLTSAAVTSAACMLIAGCSKSTGAAASAPATGPITIGALLPQTGANATDGESALNGMNLAVSEINAAGGINGRKLSIVTADDQSTNQGTLAGFTKLSTSHPVAIVGPSVSSEVEAAAPFIAQADVPFFFGGTLPSLTHAGNQWLFRDRPTDEYFAKAIADYGVSHLHITSWAVLHSTDVFGAAANTYLVKDLEGDGASVVTDLGYQSGTSDFTSVVLQLKSAKAKGLATFLTSAEDNGVFASQRQQLGGSAPWVASGSAVATPSLKLAGPSLNGAYAVSDYVANENPAAVNFAAAYREKYGVVADVNSAYTYDAVNIVAAAIKAAGTTNGTKLRAAILALRNFQGVDGMFNFDQYGDGVHTVNVVHVKNAKPTYVSTLHLPTLPYIQS